MNLLANLPASPLANAPMEASAPNGAPVAAPFRPTLFARLYGWTIHWCRTPYALPALCLVAFADSSFFPVPPDVLLIGTTLAHPRKWLRNALCALGSSVLGGLFGWLIGAYLWHLVSPWLFAHVPGFRPEYFVKVEELYKNNAFLIILVAPFSFLPYKIFTISAGICGVPIPTLVAASLLGRGTRFFLVAGAIRLFGDKATTFLSQYFKRVMLAITVTIVLAFVAIKMLHHTGIPKQIGIQNPQATADH